MAIGHISKEVIAIGCFCQQSQFLTILFYFKNKKYDSSAKLSYNNSE